MNENDFIPLDNSLIIINKNFEKGVTNLSKSSFTFISELGKGAFGNVYKVSFKDSGNIYALKVLSKKQLTALDLKEQLKREISILANCNHENIIKLFCCFEDTSYIYMVLELANEFNLAKKIREFKVISENQSKLYMLDILSAINYLHDQNPIIIHRDIKPENILINNGKCKIADFGWSNTQSDIRNTFCGTPDYLAPEMIRGNSHTEKLDIWCLGVLFFEMINGRAPFQINNNLIDTRMKQKAIEKSILEGVYHFDKNISKEAKEIIIAMLNPNDKKRPCIKQILGMNFFMDNISNTPHIQDKLIKNQSLKEGRDNNEKNILKEIDSLNERIKILQEQNFLKEKQIKELLVELNKKNINQSNQDNINEILKLEKDKIRDEISLEYKISENKLKQEIKKHEETSSFLFTRTKELSKKISNFFNENIKNNNNLNITTDHILSYESTINKLEFIFNEFKKNIAELNFIAKNHKLNIPIIIENDKQDKIINDLYYSPNSKNKIQSITTDLSYKTLDETELALNCYFKKPIK